MLLSNTRNSAECKHMQKGDSGVVQAPFPFPKLIKDATLKID